MKLTQGLHLFAIFEIVKIIIRNLRFLLKDISKKLSGLKLSRTSKKTYSHRTSTVSPYLQMSVSVLHWICLCLFSNDLQELLFVKLLCLACSINKNVEQKIVCNVCVCVYMCVCVCVCVCVANLRKYEKVCWKLRKCTKSWESMRKCAKS